MSLFLLSDTHFEHANIIKYCDRPFSSASEMDSVMISNWNERVSYDDTVLFGGDIAMARGEIAIEYAQKLNGSLVLLDGNHDDVDESEAPFPILKSYYFTYEYEEGTEYDFYYTHWPLMGRSIREDSRDAPKWSKPPEWFDGWYLHGHVHNNDVDNYPFVNPNEQMVNLGVELLDFTPIEIEELIRILDTGGRYETVSDVPEDMYPF